MFNSIAGEENAVRLFIGIAVPPFAQSILSEASAQHVSSLGARCISPEMYHVTLAFLGQREEDSLPLLCDILSRTAAGREPFPVTANGLGVFHGANVLYAAVKPDAPLIALAADLCARLDAAGEPYDPKPFIPHISLARKAKPPAPYTPPPIPDVSFLAEAVTLYHSTRIDGRLRYLPLFQAKLTAIH